MYVQFRIAVKILFTAQDLLCELSQRFRHSVDAFFRAQVTYTGGSLVVDKSFGDFKGKELLTI